MRRRAVRMACKLALLISLPLTGFCWAFTSDPTVPSTAWLLTAISVLLGMAAEHMASSTESELAEAQHRLEEAKRGHAADLARRDAKLDQQERIINVMAAQDHDLRAKLISMHAKMHSAGLMEDDK